MTVRDSGLPETVDRFIRDVIDRLETLDVLGLMFANPSRRWTIDDLTREMRSSGTASKMAVEALVRAGLVAQEQQAFFCQPASVELEDGARRTLDCYRDRRIAVIAAIYQNRRPTLSATK